MMEHLRELVQNKDSWLVHRILDYAREGGEDRYWEDLTGALPLAVSRLTRVLSETLAAGIQPDAGPAPDPGVEFGKQQAKSHREWGVDIGAYLGMLKHYRQSYFDLIAGAGFEPDCAQYCRLFLEGFFSRIEMGFYAHWSDAVESRLLAEIEVNNRLAAGEYLTIFRNLPNPVILLDQNYQIENINHAAAELFLWYRDPTNRGLSLKERIFHWLAGELTWFAGSNSLQHICEKELPGVRENRYFEVKLLRIPVQPAKFSGIIIILNDLTERRRTERALRESEEKFRKLFQNADDAIFLFELPGGGSPGRYIEVNAAARRWLGYSRDELLTMTPAQILASENLKQLPQLMQELVSRGCLTSEVSYVSKQGVRIPVEASSHVFALNGKQVVLVIARNIGQRLEAAKALRESEERYRRLVELTPDAIVVHCEGKIVFANPATSKLLGVSPQEVEGRMLLDFLHPDYWELARERIRRIVEEGKSGPLAEEKIVKPNGEVLDAEVLAAPFTFQGKQAVQVVARDITGRKKLEEEFLKNSKLESLGILAGGIAHDFNNILTVILGNINLARSAVSAEDRVSAKLIEIEQAALEARNLTQQLLTFAKGGMPVKKTMSLGSLIREATTFALSGSNVRCECFIQAGLWPAAVDEGQINQVINNLIINAKQAMPEGGTVRVFAENTVVPPGSGIDGSPVRKFVKISFIDEGVGIPAVNLAKIFDPYFTTKENGTGLGLATVYSIIKNHDGYVLVKSEEEAGTCFEIYLPASEDKVEVREPESRQAPAGSGRVLVMDDEYKVIEVMVQMLNHLGYEAEFARDGSEAVEMYRDAMEAGRRFDAVLMDLTVPGGMGGKEAIGALLKLDPGVKAVVVSGYSDDPVLTRFHDYGFKGFVAKPFSLEELGTVLNDLLQNLTW